MLDAGAAVLGRKQGLIVPPDAQKRSRVMARQKFLKLNRYMAFSRTYGLSTRFLCTVCKQPVRLARGDSDVIQTDMANNTVDPRKDKFSMACSCSVWTVK